VAVSEMAFAGNLGATVMLKEVPLGDSITRNDLILFSESNSRFLVEVTREDAAKFEKIMGDVPCSSIGEVTSLDTLQVSGLDNDIILNVKIDKLKEAWQKPLKW